MDFLQAKLNFEGWQSPQFESSEGLGRIGLSGFLLGIFFGAHLTLVVLSALVDIPPVLVQWAFYVVCLSGFHFSEFLVTALFRPHSVNYDSFVINHSKAYTIAAISSWTEYWVESLLIPRNYKFSIWVFGAGFALVIIGQFFRAAAMWTAKSNFNHIIMEQRARGHELVQHGVYRYLRHPSYFGWFWWCIGTQALLCNPLCTAAYAAAAWDFFRKRIPYEEATLCRFYPDEYPDYIGRTFIGIPFVNGVALDLLPAARQQGRSDSSGRAAEVGVGNKSD